MRLLMVTWLALISSLECGVSLVASQQDLPLWSQQVLSPKELLVRPYFLDLPSSSSSSSAESPDYDVASQKMASSFPSSSRQQSSSSSSGTLKKRVAMGVDLPDYILHYRGRSPDLLSFRERMQLSGRR